MRLASALEGQEAASWVSVLRLLVEQGPEGAGRALVASLPEAERPASREDLVAAVREAVRAELRPDALRAMAARERPAPRPEQPSGDAWVTAAPWTDGPKRPPQRRARLLPDEEEPAPPGGNAQRRLSDDRVRELRAAYDQALATKAPLRDVAKALEVSYSTLWNVGSRRRYTSVPESAPEEPSGPDEVG